LVRKQELGTLLEWEGRRREILGLGLLSSTRRLAVCSREAPDQLALPSFLLSDECGCVRVCVQVGNYFCGLWTPRGKEAEHFAKGLLGGKEELGMAWHLSE
jgi:hypothetical protein